MPSINDQIFTMRNLRSQTYTQEKTAIESFLKSKQPAGAYVVGKIYVNSVGQKVRFLGYDESGEAMGDLVE